MTRSTPLSAHHNPTIGDVARLAGVSRSAVSRAYTPGTHISAKMRKRVEDAAAELGYRPNLIARSLSTRRSNTVAVAITRLENAFHAELLQHLANGLHARGLHLLLFVMDPMTDPDPPIDDLLRHRVGAIILSAVRFSSRYAAECRASGVPVVMVNRATMEPDVSAVFGDNVGGGRLVGELFARLGHQRPIFISGFPDSSTSISREAGFHAALTEAGVIPLPSVSGRFDKALTEDVTRRLLSGPNPPDAIFCANDHMAIAALQIARHEFGLAVGRDISIVGYDNSATAMLPDIGLTTVAQPAAVFAQEAIEAIFSLMADPDAPVVRRQVKSHLVERVSSLPSR